MLNQQSRDCAQPCQRVLSRRHRGREGERERERGGGGVAGEWEGAVEGEGREEEIER